MHGFTVNIFCLYAKRGIKDIVFSLYLVILSTTAESSDAADTLCHSKILLLMETKMNERDIT